MADLENFLDCGFDVTLRKIGDRIICKGVQSRHLAPSLVVETVGETIEQAAGLFVERASHAIGVVVGPGYGGE